MSASGDDALVKMREYLIFTAVHVGWCNRACENGADQVRQTRKAVTLRMHPDGCAREKMIAHGGSGDASAGDVPVGKCVVYEISF